MNIIDVGLEFAGSLTPLNKDNVQDVILHHMAHDTWELEDVHNFHKKTNGWAGIGYNFFIAKNGETFKGRGFNVGAHALNHNATSVGVGFQGDFESSDSMTSEQVESARKLIEYINDWAGKELNIKGHRDVGNTACPGKYFKMDQIKKEVKTPIERENNINLTVDGKWGNQTTKALQQYLGTVEDGIISDQLRNSVSESLYGDTVEFGDGNRGSMVIKALQKHIGYSGRGLLGQNTVTNLQRHLGTPQDGLLSRPSLAVRTLQRKLNNNTL